MNIIRDKNQNIIGRMDEKTIRDTAGNIVGRYDPTTNVTRDSSGARVGEGDLRMMLLGR